jgi:hypothetical protein
LLGEYFAAAGLLATSTFGFLSLKLDNVGQRRTLAGEDAVEALGLSIANTKGEKIRN